MHRRNGILFADCELLAALCFEGRDRILQHLDLFHLRLILLLQSLDLFTEGLILSIRVGALALGTLQM